MNSFNLLLFYHSWLSLISQSSTTMSRVPLHHQPPLTKIQEEKISSLLSSGLGSNRTFSLQDIDGFWHNNEAWTLKLLNALLKKGYVSRVLWKTSYTSFHFEIRFHFPKLPFTSDLTAIKRNRAYYEPIEARYRIYDNMLQSRLNPLSEKQSEILDLFRQKFGQNIFTRADVNALFWQNTRNSKTKAHTFAHQLLHLVAKGKLRVVEGSHLTGPYALVELSTDRELHSNIFNASLSLINKKADPWAGLL